jgi:hypothetical protein
MKHVLLDIDAILSQVEAELSTGKLAKGRKLLDEAREKLLALAEALETGERN